MNTKQTLEVPAASHSDAVSSGRPSYATQGDSASVSCDLDRLCSQGMGWIEHLLDSGGREIATNLVGTGLVLVCRHPAASILLAAGGFLFAWSRRDGRVDESTVRGYAQARLEDAKDAAHNARDFASRAGSRLVDSVQSAAGRLRDLRQSASPAIESIGDSYGNAVDAIAEDAERVAKRARQLGKEAEVSYKKVQRFSQEQPAVAVAGGVALVMGVLLVAKVLRK